MCVSVSGCVSVGFACVRVFVYWFGECWFNVCVCVLLCVILCAGVVCVFVCWFVVYVFIGVLVVRAFRCSFSVHC